MKKIFSPTDFSRASQKTLPYLREFHRLLQADITLVHTYETRSTASMLKSLDRIMEEDANRRIANWKTELVKGLDSDEGIHTRVVRGNTVEVIKEMVNKEDFDLAVFGTTGVSGFLEMVEGSFTNKVLKQTKVPILAIPEDFDYKPMDTIVLAVDDLKFETVETLKPFFALAKAYNSKLWVYHKDTGDHAAPALEQELAELPSVSYFHEPQENGSILESILAFSKDQDAGLLCMVRHKQSFIDKTLNLSTTSQGLFAAMLPMLFLSE